MILNGGPAGREDHKEGKFCLQKREKNGDQSSALQGKEPKSPSLESKVIKTKPKCEEEGKQSLLGKRFIRNFKQKEILLRETKGMGKRKTGRELSAGGRGTRGC